MGRVRLVGVHTTVGVGDDDVREGPADVTADLELTTHMLAPFFPRLRELIRRSQRLLRARIAPIAIHFRSSDWSISLLPRRQLAAPLKAVELVRPARAPKGAECA